MPHSRPWSPRSLSSTRCLLIASCCVFSLPALGFAANDSDNTGAAERNTIKQPAWYFEFSAGTSIVPNQTLQDGGTSMSRVESDPGFMVAGSLGTRIFDSFRAELQIGYREADVHKLGVSTSPMVSDGETSLLTVIANGYLDLDLDIGVIPYLGFGLGWGEYKLDSRTKTRGELEFDDADSVFVYNAMIGALVPITEVASASIGYRYIAAEGTDNIGGIINDVSQDIESEFDAHEISLGLRFHF